MFKSIQTQKYKILQKVYKLFETLNPNNQIATIQQQTNTQMNQHQQNQSFIKSIIRTPWTTRTYLLAVIFFHSLNYITQQWSYVNLSSNFFITILNYRVWRFFINFLYEPNLWVVVLMVFHLHNYLSKFERQNGTVITFFEIFTIALLSQFFTLCYQALIYLLNDNQIIDNWRVMYNIGSGAIFINIYFKLLWFNFKQNNRKCSCRAIFTYLYPLVLIIVSSLLSQQTRVDMITAYILAIVECTIFRGGMIFFTPDTYTEKQQIIRYIKLHKFPCCNYALLNQQKIKPNRLGVVQAQQFYTLKGYTPAQSTQQLHQVQMQTQRGSFHNRSNQMVEDEISIQGKGEKWQQTQTIEED